MKYLVLLFAALLALPAAAESPWDMGKKAIGGAATGKLEGEINQRLLAESRKNQCAFKTDTDRLEPGCDPKAKRLANAIIDAKKKLDAAGIQNFKFEVSGHTDSRGSAEHNRALSERPAAAIKGELERKGIPGREIVAVGMAFDRPLVKPDDTEKKRARNRRYEIRVRL